MSKFGKKFTCWSCGTKFYDLNKPNPKCPKCGANPDDDPNKGMPSAPPQTYGEDFGEEIEEEIEEEAADEEELEEEPGEEGPEEDY